MTFPFPANQLETQMDTSETSQLSEIFSILEDTGGEDAHLYIGPLPRLCI